MPAIITVTFSPAIDKSTSVPVLIPERKLICSPPTYQPGGGGINVARAIKKLGGEAIAIYLAGGYTGKAFAQLLAAESVECIVTETKESTRENLVVVEIASNQQYRFGMPGPLVYEAEWQDCLKNIERIQDVEYIVASGSLPQGVPTDILAKIALIARKKNARLIIDTTDEALKQAAHIGVYLIKPNLRELGSLIGKEDLNVELVGDAAREVIDRGNCEVVVVSMGAFGAILVTKDLEVQVMPPAVKVRSTVGAGDCMVAGIVMGLASNKSLVETIQYGVACGTAATMNPGTELCRKEDVERLYGIIRSKTPV